MRQKQLVLLYLLFFLLAATTVGMIVFEGPLQGIIRASGTTPSAQKSLILANKILAKPSDKIELNVFIRNEQGEAIPDKVVTPNTNAGSLSPPTATTDQSGKASFVLVSDGAKEATIRASTEGVAVANSITVYFTQQ